MSYPDPYILEELIKSSTSYSSMTLASNDRELRVRAIQYWMIKMRLTLKRWQTKRLMRR